MAVAKTTTSTRSVVLKDREILTQEFRLTGNIPILGPWISRASFSPKEPVVFSSTEPALYYKISADIIGFLVFALYNDAPNNLGSFYTFAKDSMQIELKINNDNHLALSDIPKVKIIPDKSIYWDMDFYVNPFRPVLNSGIASAALTHTLRMSNATTVDFSTIGGSELDVTLTFEKILKEKE